MMIAYSKYYNSDLALDYQTRKRLVSTYMILSEKDRQDSWLSEEQKKAFAYFPEIQRAGKLMSLAIASLIGFIALAAATFIFIGK
jgi:hypothetical protein